MIANTRVPPPTFASMEPQMNQSFNSSMPMSNIQNITQITAQQYQQQHIQQQLIQQKLKQQQLQQQQLQQQQLQQQQLQHQQLQQQQMQQQQQQQYQHYPPQQLLQQATEDDNLRPSNQFQPTKPVSSDSFPQIGTFDPTAYEVKSLCLAN